MLPYSRIGSRLIKPHNLYTYTDDAKKYFFARFGGDKQSFDFLHYLIRYCCKKNQGEWPSVITPEIAKSMCEDAGFEITISETKIFRDGYLIKDAANYELTHEFIVSSFMCCSDGNFLPLSTGHIDFTGGEEISTFLREQVFVEEPQVVTFLVKLIIDMEKPSGILVDKWFRVKRLKRIAMENNLIFELCFKLAQNYNLIAMVDESTVICNGLIFSAYLASPRLD